MLYSAQMRPLVPKSAENDRECVGVKNDSIAFSLSYLYAVHASGSSGAMRFCLAISMQCNAMPCRTILAMHV
jgi:hypothetical protein